MLQLKAALNIETAITSAKNLTLNVKTAMLQLKVASNVETALVIQTFV